MDLDTCLVSIEASSMEKIAMVNMIPETCIALTVAPTTAMVERDAEELMDGVLVVTMAMAGGTASTLASLMVKNMVNAMAVPLMTTMATTMVTTRAVDSMVMMTTKTTVTHLTLATEAVLNATMVKRDAKDLIKISAKTTETDTCGVSTRASCTEKSAIAHLTPETCLALTIALITEMVERDAVVLKDGVLEATMALVSCTASTLASHMVPKPQVVMAKTIWPKLVTTMAADTTLAPQVMAHAIMEN